MSDPWNAGLELETSWPDGDRQVDRALFGYLVRCVRAGADVRMDGDAILVTWPGGKTSDAELPFSPSDDGVAWHTSSQY